MATLTQMEAFIENMLPYAETAGNQIGVNPNLILGQWANETGYGTSTAATQDNNYGGITYNGQLGVFSSIGNFVSAFVSTITNNFPSALNTGNSVGYVNALENGRTKYATDPNYADKVISNAQQITNVEQTMGLTVPNASSVTGTLSSILGSSALDALSPVSGVTSALTGDTTTGAASGCSGVNGLFNWSCYSSAITDLLFIGLGIVLIFGVIMLVSDSAKQTIVEAVT